VSWHYEHTVTGWTPDAEKANEGTTELAVIHGDSSYPGTLELCIGRPDQQLCYGWQDAPGRIRLNAEDAKRLAFLILSRYG
jgi:hypothetical protein